MLIIKYSAAIFTAGLFSTDLKGTNFVKISVGVSNVKSVLVGL